MDDTLHALLDLTHLPNWQSDQKIMKGIRVAVEG